MLITIPMGGDEATWEHLLGELTAEDVAQLLMQADANDDGRIEYDEFMPLALEVVEALRLRIADFARERDWDQFHTPRNILLAPVWKSIIEQAARRWRGG